MTNQEINVAIAEACGWTHIENRNPMAMGGHWFGYPPVNAIIGKKAPIPDFASDLNAMTAVEKWLDSQPMDLQSMYLDYLYCTVGWGDTNNAKDAKFKCYYGSVRATARQRAEAFLRTIGKWTE